MKTKAKRPKPGLSEREVQRQCLEAFQLFGVQMDRRNTGGLTNPKGQYVPFNTPGDSDLTGTLPDGRRIDVECKREGFVPPKPGTKAREHFERQLERLRRVNASGGVGFWCDDSVLLSKVILPLLIDGGWVEEPEDEEPMRLVRRTADTVPIKSRRA